MFLELEYNILNEKKQKNDNWDYDWGDNNTSNKK